MDTTTFLSNRIYDIKYQSWTFHRKQSKKNLNSFLCPDRSHEMRKYNAISYFLCEQWRCENSNKPIRVQPGTGVAAKSILFWWPEILNNNDVTQSESKPKSRESKPATTWNRSLKGRIWINHMTSENVNLLETMMIAVIPCWTPGTPHLMQHSVFTY